MISNLFRDDKGITTTSTVLALLLSIALIFSGTQMYKVYSSAADIQNVADASALAGSEPIAQYYSAVQVCDAFVLSLNLSGSCVCMVGTVLLCVPPLAGIGETCIKSGEKIFHARDSFVKEAEKGLNAYQKALPFLCAAKSIAVMQKNADISSNHSYQGFALLNPMHGQPVEIGFSDEGSEKEEDCLSHSEEIKALGEEAEKHSAKAQELKKKAYEADCGKNPGLCMEERARKLSSLDAQENPHYESVDAWNLEVGLKRARAYYAKRIKNENPSNYSDIKEQAQSALRLRFYAFAQEELKDAYAKDEESICSVNLPLFPKNTKELKETKLYTEYKFPVSKQEEKLCIHAFDSCPGISSIASYETLQYAEQNNLEECQYCQFKTSSLGKVAAASSSISNGFEFHYREYVKAARDYEKEQEKAIPAKDETKKLVEDTFSRLQKVLKSQVNKRIKVKPPGRCGVIVVVFDNQAISGKEGLDNSFVQSNTKIGARVAISGSILVGAPCKDGKNPLESALKEISREFANPLLSVGAVASKFWGKALFAYSDGIDGLLSVVEHSLDGFPLVGPSGLGLWAADKLKEGFKDFGLEPVTFEDLRPVLINTEHISSAGNSVLSAKFVSIKKMATSSSGKQYSTFLEALVSEGVEKAKAVIEDKKSQKIAEIEIEMAQGGKKLFQFGIPQL